MGGGLYVVEHDCDRDRARILARCCHVGPITPGVELNLAEPNARRSFG